MGGAFAALADDATAAFANPAGLVQLLEPEVSMEGRSSSYHAPFVTGGRANGTPTGEGIDDVEGLRLGTSSHDTAEVSFLSFVMPWDRVSMAVYRHTWADFSVDTGVNGLFGEIDGELDRSEDVRTHTRLKVVNTGFVAGFELGGGFSLGIGAVAFQGDMSAVSDEYRQEEEAFFELSPFDDALLETEYSYQAATFGWVVHGGLLWRISAQWSVGAYYRQGPELDIHVVETTGPADTSTAEGTIELDIVTPLRLPDVWGVGAAYRTPNGRFVASFEWARVEYTSIANSINGKILAENQIAADDSNEIHVGLEYVLATTMPIVALRVGAWRDPAHTVGSGPAAELFERTIFRSGEDEIHYAIGAGVAFQRVQIDLGVDHSSSSDLASLSFVFRF